MSENKSIIDLAKAAQSAPRAEEAPPVTRGEEVSRPREAVPGESDAPKDILDGLLQHAKSKLSWCDLKLPSAGLGPTKVETIEIRPFTFEDEKILRTAKSTIEGEAIIQKLISRCIQGIDYKDLLLVDKNYILFKLREISYGDSYDISVTCGSCGTENELQVQLSKLPVVYAETSSDLEHNILLPDSEVEVVIKALTVDHETLMSSPETLMDNLWRLIDSIGGHSERTVKQGFIAGTTAKDISVIRQAIFGGDIGMQTKVNFICNSCEGHDVLELPINEGFFDAN
tara:strand:- start:627 stop:1481 length:855 start_codon:yes stop_codon:yes gene_type:complete